MGEKPAAEESSRKTTRAATQAGFYAGALSEIEQVALSQARELEGLDEEIALLRVRLRSMADDPEQSAPFIKTAELLVKAVSARYRLSKKSQNDLMDAVAAVLDGVGGALLRGAGDI